VASISTAHAYSRVIAVEVHAYSPVQVDQQIVVGADIHTGNNRVESVTNVSAFLMLPEGASLISEMNPIFIGRMGPGPADDSCNWTVAFSQPGAYTVSVNVSCVDTQYIPRWLMNSTTVEVYDFPYVEFTYPNINVHVNRTVVFNATGSHARAPGGWIVSYEWNFGDGEPFTVFDSVAEHVFRVVGNYEVSLNVTDSRGLSSMSSSSIVVSLLGDVNLDNVVNILDVSFVAHCFGSHFGDDRWDARSDLNSDGTVDILDVSLVALGYGTTG
jgi:PKD repeat protein